MDRVITDYDRFHPRDIFEERRIRREAEEREKRQHRPHPTAPVNAKSWNDWFAAGFANHLTASMRRDGLVGDVLVRIMVEERQRARDEYEPKIGSGRSRSLRASCQSTPASLSWSAISTRGRPGAMRRSAVPRAKRASPALPQLRLLHGKLIVSAIALFLFTPTANPGPPSSCAICSNNFSTKPPSDALWLFTDEEMDLLITLASPLRPSSRGDFLRLVANKLSGYPPTARGVGLLHRIGVEAQQDFLNVAVGAYRNRRRRS